MCWIEINRYRGFLNLTAMLVFGFSIVSLSTVNAMAASGICNSLQSQLVSLSRVSSAPSARYLQYDRAVRDQQSQIAKTKAAARSNNCIFFNLSNICRRINSSLKKMNTNLSSLKKTRKKYARGPSGNRSQIAALQRDLQRNNCVGYNTQTPTIKNDVRPRRRTLLEQVFGVKTYSNDGKSNRDDYRGDQSMMNRYNTFRTLCVRTCDGYYFPVSFSTTYDRMEKDLNACQQMCPGTPTALFFHEMPNQDAEQSISYKTGEPYSDLENAFAYRKAVNPECSCRFSQEQFQEVAGSSLKIQSDELVGQNEAVIQRIGLPIFRQDPALDPDTLGNQSGRLTLKKFIDIVSDGAANDATAERKNDKIRIVGPAFFPVQ